MKSFSLRVYEADAPFYEGDCLSLVIPTPDGQYGILANHENTITAVVNGTMKFTLTDGTKVIASVSEGLVKVENNDVLVLIDTAERPEDIDINRAQRAIDEAREMILQKRTYTEYRLAKDAIARNLTRIKLKDK